MAVDVNRLTPGEQLVGVSAAALFVVSFLHWFGGRITSLTVNGQTIATSKYQFVHGAWGYTATLIAVVIGLLEIAYVVARLAGLERPRGAGVALAIAGGVAFVLVAAQLLAGASVNLNSFGLPSVTNLGGVHLSFEKTRGAGAYAGLVAAFGVAAGGLLSAREG
jgi:hypothetical protein